MFLPQKQSRNRPVGLVRGPGIHGEAPEVVGEDGPDVGGAVDVGVADDRGDVVVDEVAAEAVAVGQGGQEAGQRVGTSKKALTQL